MNQHNDQEDVIFLKNVDQDLSILYAALQPHGYTCSQIDTGWMRFWNADQRSEYVYYSQEDAEAELQKMFQEYIENSLGSPLTQDAITLQVAQETGLEPANLTGEGWHFPKFIEGGDGIGYRTVWGK